MTINPKKAEKAEKDWNYEIWLDNRDL